MPAWIAALYIEHCNCSSGHGLIDELDLMHNLGEEHYDERKLNRDHIHMPCLLCSKIIIGTLHRRVQSSRRNDESGHKVQNI